MGGLLGATGAAEGAGAAGGAQTGAGVAAAGGATAAGGLGSAAASGLANSAAQGAAMQTLNPQAVQALGEGFQSGVLQSIYGNQWQGGTAAPQAEAAAIPAAASQVPPLSASMPNLQYPVGNAAMTKFGANLPSTLSAGGPDVAQFSAVEGNTPGWQATSNYGLQSPGVGFGQQLKQMIAQKFRKPNLGGGGGGQAPQHTQDMIAQILAAVMKGGTNGLA